MIIIIIIIIITIIIIIIIIQPGFDNAYTYLLFRQTLTMHTVTPKCLVACVHTHLCVPTLYFRFFFCLCIPGVHKRQECATTYLACITRFSKMT